MGGLDMPERDWAGAGGSTSSGSAGPGMSGLALVCARPRADRYRGRSQRLPLIWSGSVRRGSRRRSATTPRTCSRGAEVVVLDRDRRREPRAGARPRARDRADSPWGVARRALCREAADRDRRHPRQDDDDRDGGLGAARAGGGSGLLRRRRGAGLGPDGAPANAGWGDERVGGRRGRRVRRQLPAPRPRDRRRHQRRDGPPLQLGLARAAGRGLRPSSPAVPRRGPARPHPRRRSPRARSARSLWGGRPRRLPPPSAGVPGEERPTDARAAGAGSWRSSRPTRPGRKSSALPSPGATTCRCPCRLAAIETRRDRPRGRCGGARDFRGVRRRLERKGERGGVRIHDDYAHHPTIGAALSALRDSTRPGCRRLPAPPLLADKVSATSSARPSPSPTRSPCSTSIRPASNRGGLAGVSGAADRGGRPSMPGRGRLVDVAAGGRRRARAWLAATLLGVGDICLAIGRRATSAAGRRPPADGRCAAGRLTCALAAAGSAGLPARPPDDDRDRRAGGVLRGGRAAPASLDELLGWARERGLELSVVGSGSNLLVADEGSAALSSSSIGISRESSRSRGVSRLVEARGCRRWPRGRRRSG